MKFNVSLLDFSGRRGKGVVYIGKLGRRCVNLNQMKVWALGIWLALIKRWFISKLGGLLIVLLLLLLLSLRHVILVTLTFWTRVLVPIIPLREDLLSGVENYYGLVYIRDLVMVDLLRYMVMLRFLMIIFSLYTLRR